MSRSPLFPRSRKERLLAIQPPIEELDVEWNIHPMVGPLACCPRCGRERLEGYEQKRKEPGDRGRFKGSGP